MVKLTGKSIIGFREDAGSGEVFYATNPKTGQQLAQGFYSATDREVDAAAKLAHEAFELYGRASGHDKAAFLRTIATNIEANASEIIERAEQETALPKARLQGEVGRTCGQLRLFAQVVEEGSWT